MGEGTRIPKQANVVVHSKDDRAELERDLFGIGVPAQVSLVHRLSNGARQLAPPFREAREHRIAHRSRAIVVFDGATYEKTARAEFFVAHPVEPAAPDGAQPRQAA